MARFLLAVWCCVLVSPVFADKVTLEEPVDDSRIFGVGLRLEVAGKVQTPGAENKPVDLPLNVAAALSYRERRLLGLSSSAGTLRSVRDYETAQVDIEVAEEKTSVTLPSALKLIVTQGQSSGLDLYSLGGALSAQELELLTPPCDSLGLVALLPMTPVEVGDEWTPSSWVGQFLARLEATTKSEVKCRLASVDKNLARITFTIEAVGAVQGTPSQLSIQGSMDYDLATKSIAEADWKQTEKRAIGAVSVGLDVTARLKLLRKPAQSPGRLGDPAVVSAASGEAPDTALSLRFESPWTLGLLHSRQWHLFTQTDKVAIFRLLDDGLFIAQCNLSPIPAARRGEHTSEQTFQSDIQQSLGERLKVLGTGETIVTKDGRYLYRITAEGAIGERNLTWIYYLCADPSGKQASLMFAVDTALLEKLGNRDREFAQSLVFGAPRAAALFSK